MENRNDSKDSVASLNAGLYVVGTPIGNLGDITLRALETLRSVDVIMAEDTRHSRKLLTHFEIRKRLISCHKFNEASRLDYLKHLIFDKSMAVALITDSGMPCISDPGSRSVAACHDLEIPVTVIPGPSALTDAAALSGMITKGFYFEGFLSHKSAARKKRLKTLSELDVPLIFFESPYRLLKLLGEIGEVLGGRETFVGRELTKHFEETLRGTTAEIITAFGERKVKGECVVIVGRKERVNV